MRAQNESPQERFSRLLDLCTNSMKKHGLDREDYLNRIKREGIASAVSDLARDLEKRDVFLPPGYWAALFALRDEVSPPLSKS
jgi:hypothetical protein